MNFAKLLKIIFNRTALCDCFCNFNIAKARFSFYCALFTNLRYFLNILPKSVNYIVYINIYYILYIYYINYILSIYIYIYVYIYIIYIYIYTVALATLLKSHITLQRGCSPVNLLHIFRTLFSQNTYGGLLLFFFLNEW